MCELVASAMAPVDMSGLARGGKESYTSMVGQRNTSEIGDVERELREAEEAQAAAEAAVQRATMARAEAEAAQLRAEEQREVDRRQWAQAIVDAYDANLAAAEQAIRDASDRFAEAAVRDLPAAVTAYMDWAEASLRHYTLQVRVATVAPILDLQATPGERLSPPPFSEALNAAIELHVAALSGRIRDEAAAELEARLGDGAGEQIVI